MNTSPVVVGAIFAQKYEGGKVRPVQYASSTMNPTDRKYLILETKALKVMFALKEFGLYLLSSEKHLP